MNNIDYIKMISAPHLQHYLLPIKIAFISVSLLLLIAIIYFLVTTKYLTYVFADWIDLSMWKKERKIKKKAHQ